MKNKIIIAIYSIQFILFFDSGPSVFLVLVYLLAEFVLLGLVYAVYEFIRERTVLSSDGTLFGILTIICIFYPQAYLCWQTMDQAHDVKGIVEKDIFAPLFYHIIPITITSGIIAAAIIMDINKIAVEKKYEFLQSEMFYQVLTVLGVSSAGMIAIGLFPLSAAGAVILITAARIGFETGSVYRHRKARTHNM